MNIRRLVILLLLGSIFCGLAVTPALLMAQANPEYKPGKIQALDSTLTRISARQGDPIPVPALYLHGANDGGMGVELTEGMEAAFAMGLEKRIIPGAGHFVHQEKPEEVNKLILAFLKK
jgi:pimeloyl-ACP methyl ester carboxylesterase